MGESPARFPPFLSFLPARSGVFQTLLRACRSPKLLLANLPLTWICFQPWKLSAGDQ